MEIFFFKFKIIFYQKYFLNVIYCYTVNFCLNEFSVIIIIIIIIVIVKLSGV